MHLEFPMQFRFIVDTVNYPPDWIFLRWKKFFPCQAEEDIIKIFNERHIVELEEGKEREHCWVASINSLAASMFASIHFIFNSDSAIWLTGE